MCNMNLKIMVLNERKQKSIHTIRSNLYKILEKANFSSSNRFVVVRGWDGGQKRWRDRLLREMRELRGDECVHYLDCSYGFTGVCVCVYTNTNQNESNHTH